MISEKGAQKFHTDDASLPRSGYTEKNNGFPCLDILGYLKNTHKNPTFGKVRQVPTKEFPTKFPDWDLFHSSKFGISVGIISLNTLKYPKMGICFFSCGSASDWLKQIFYNARPIRSTTHIWVVMHHQYGISALVSRMSFGGETSGSVAKCWLFSQAK